MDHIETMSSFATPSLPSHRDTRVVTHNRFTFRRDDLPPCSTDVTLHKCRLEDIYECVLSYSTRNQLAGLAAAFWSLSLYIAAFIVDSKGGLINHARDISGQWSLKAIRTQRKLSHWTSSLPPTVACNKLKVVVGSNKNLVMSSVLVVIFTMLHLLEHQ